MAQINATCQYSTINHLDIRRALCTSPCCAMRSIPLYSANGHGSLREETPNDDSVDYTPETDIYISEISSAFNLAIVRTGRERLEIENAVQIFFQCAFCGDAFDLAKEWQEHQSRHHSGNQKILQLTVVCNDLVEPRSPRSRSRSRSGSRSVSRSVSSSRSRSRSSSKSRSDSDADYPSRPNSPTPE